MLKDVHTHFVPSSRCARRLKKKLRRGERVEQENHGRGRVRDKGKKKRNDLWEEFERGIGS